jgi:hypothetical protein
MYFGRMQKADQKPGVGSDWFGDLTGLGLGEMSSAPIEAAVARGLFLTRLSIRGSAALNELWSKVSPPYDDLWRICVTRFPNERFDYPMVSINTETEEFIVDELCLMNRWAELVKAAKAIPSAARIVQEVEQWLNRRHLQADWMRESIWSWIVVNKAKHKSDPAADGLLVGTFATRGRQRFIAFPHLGPGTIGADPPSTAGPYQAAVPTLRPYNPLAETRADYLNEMANEVRKYASAQESTLKKFGFKKTKRVAKRHIDWFVDYQVLNKSQGEIAQAQKSANSIDDSAVYRAVSGVARHLGLKLRPGKARGKSRSK